MPRRYCRCDATLLFCLRFFADALLFAAIERRCYDADDRPISACAAAMLERHCRSAIWPALLRHCAAAAYAMMMPVTLICQRTMALLRC